MIVRGEPGIGKSALLEVFAGLAADAGFRVAFGPGPGQDLPGRPLAVAGHIVGRLTAQPGEPAQAAAPHGHDAPSGDLVQELVDAVRRSAGGSPVALCLDGVAHLDPWSARWLAALSEAASGVPLAIALTGGDFAVPDEPAPAAELAARAERIDLTGLDPAQLGALAAARCDVTLDEPAAAVCHELTGGNPGLLLALLAAHTGTAPTVGALRDTAASAVLPGTERWLAGLGGPALGLARAVAVLGPDAEITQCADLAGLSVRETLPLVDELVDRSLLANRTPLSFRHPLLALMVIGRIPAGTRAALHLKAAEILRDGHFEVIRVGEQLVAAGPLGATWALRPLQIAADRLEREGRYEEAARHLRGMLRQRLRPRVRSAVQRRLAELNGFAAPEPTARRLDAARYEADNPGIATDYAVALGTLLTECGRPEDAVAVLEDTAERLAPTASAQRWRLRLHTAFTRSTGPAAPAGAAEPLDALAAQAPPDEEAQRELAALRAVHAVHDGGDRDAAVRDARRALSGGGAPARLLRHACGVLVHADELAEAWRYCGRVLPLGRTEPGKWEDVTAGLLRAVVLRTRGSLTEADAALTPMVDVLRPAASSGHLSAVLAVAALVEIRAQTGDTDAALALLTDCGLDDELPPRQDTVAVLAARATLWERGGDPARALEDLFAAGRLLTDARIRNPAVLPWRSRAARLLVQRGDVVEASGLAAAEEGDARRWGTPRAVGTAQHALALTESDDRRVRRLAAAVETLAHSPDRLQLALARCDLGAALSEADRADAARTEFAAALSLARSCGAQPLVHRVLAARDRAHTTGEDEHVPPALTALTPQEQRVLGLARAGHTNRAIARKLFVTVRTVEFHLSGAYRKLGISGRQELADVIPAPLDARSG
ncbi:LuxR family transcriptional regulator [Streptomyces ruber]|uniref:LuxR family transcriptional regulator n=2 Tax=Streptomyces TaxID=1883 RepID=A0A918EVN0_9ACTN|nr:LuxR family transcriptional regulator [Streptomyces ruber]